MDDRTTPLTLEPPREARGVANWLLLCAAGVLLMIVLGGAVRLTRSGLSITEWRPITGAVPPLDHAAWEAEFARYRATPEFRKVQPDMTLDEFRDIYWMEYTHRLVGRLVGLVFVVPFVVFLVRRRIDRRLGAILGLALVIGTFQAVLGWLMVKSGLVDQPRVSPYRLAAHLLTAVVLYSLLLVTALRMRAPLGPAVLHPRLRAFARVVVGVLLVAITSGGFVAGTRAGYYFNTFPTMDGLLVPDGMGTLAPFWRDLFENVVTVQFTHRVLALTVTVLALLLWTAAWRAGGAARQAGHLVLVAVAIQVTLGATTVVHGVPVVVAVLHQAGALLVLTALWIAEHRFARGRPRVS